MTKDELIQIFEELGVPKNEGVSSENNNGKIPRIVFWEFLWEGLNSSGDTYLTNVTYQISFYSNTPRDPKLMKLRKLLREHNCFPDINIEFVQEDKIYHYFFALEVLEELEV